MLFLTLVSGVQEVNLEAFTNQTMSTRVEEKNNTGEAVEQSAEKETAVHANISTETEDSEDRLESSVSVLVSLRETEESAEQEGAVSQNADWVRKLPGAVIDQDPKDLINRERAFVVWEEPRSWMESKVGTGCIITSSCWTVETMPGWSLLAERR